MNAEHDEAASIDRLAKPRLDALRAQGGVVMGRRARVDENDELELTYVVVLPLPVGKVKVTLLDVRSP